MLALDLYFREGANAPRSSTDALSQILRAFPIEAELAANPSFRSEASVRQKLGNFTWIDPSATGGLHNASIMDVRVWDEFHNDRDRLALLAERIRTTVAVRETTEIEESDPDFEEAEEGAILTRLHRTRERNRQLISKKKRSAMSANGVLACEACGFEYPSRYGEPPSRFSLG